MVFYWFRLRYDLDCVAGPLGRTTGSDLLSGQHVAASTRLPVVNVVDCGLWSCGLLSAALGSRSVATSLHYTTHACVEDTHRQTNAVTVTPAIIMSSYSPNNESYKKHSC